MRLLYQVVIFLVTGINFCRALVPGDDAPDFFLLDQDGFSHTLREHRGQFVLLFFYPRDSVHHSARVVKSFETAYPELKFKNVAIYGISNDFVKTHASFHKRFALTFDLLSDPEEEISKKYEAKGFLGRKFISYLIGPDGRIFKKYEDNFACYHPQLILHDLSQ